MDMLFETVVDSYISAKRQEKGYFSERDRFSIQHLSPHFSGRCLSSVRRRDIRNYVTVRQSAGVKLITVQRELQFLSAAINFYSAENEIEIVNPVSRLGLPRPKSRVRWITREEARRLIDSAELARRPHFPVFIRLALNTGCRRGELLGLEWPRVDFDQRLLLLEPHQNKSRRRRSVPLNDESICALMRLRMWQDKNCLYTPFVFGYLPGRRYYGFKRAFHEALECAGIENFRIHDLRHTFASWLVMNGESIYVVRDLLGHASVKQTEIYAHLAPSLGKTAVERLSFS
jgi:integrase